MKEIDNDRLMNYVYENYQSIVDFVSTKYEYKPITKIEEMSYQVTLNGYTDQIDETIDDNIYIVSALEQNQYGTTFISLHRICDGKTIQHKVKRYVYEECPCNIGDCIKAVIREQNKVTQIDGKWVENGETEIIIKDYVVIKKFE